MSAPNLNEYYLNAVIADVSTAGQVYVPVPFGGRVTKIQSVRDVATTVADATLTAKIGGTAMTNGTAVLAFTGAAVGDVDEMTPSGLNDVSAGDSIEIETDGGSTTTCITNLTITIER